MREVAKMINAVRHAYPARSTERRSHGGVYNQEVFRYLFESELTRSRRSGQFSQLVLVYQVNANGSVVQMDAIVAKIVLAAVSRSLRETDYIGWYSDGAIVGAVLTVLRQDSMGQVCGHFQKRLAEVLQAEVPLAGNHSLQVRACLPHEIETIALGEESVPPSRTH